MLSVVSGGRSRDGDALDDRVRRAATALAGIGIGPGDAVAVLLRNEIAFVEAVQAIARLGADCVPVNWHATVDETRHILEDSGASAVIAHADLIRLIPSDLARTLPIIAVATPPELAEAYRLAPADCVPPAGLPDWEALIAASPPMAGPPAPPKSPIIYTSGTTGRPKGVRRETLDDPAREAAMARLLADVYGFRDGMRTIACSPLYHAAPNSYARAALRAMATDGRLIVMPKFDAEDVLRLIEAHRVTHLWMVPTMFVALLRLPPEARRADLSSLEFVVHGAAPCPPEVKSGIIDWFGPVVHEFYASTETGPVTLASPADALARPGTVGRIIAGCEIRILGEDGSTLAPGGIGEIVCRNPDWPDFDYRNRSDERRALDRGGLIATGDIGWLDADGYLFLCDRKKEMIISGGVNVYPAEIEAALLTLPAVADCGVFGIPDPVMGEAVAVAVERAPGAALSAEEVAAHLRGRIAGYKVPRLIEFHDALPREDSGKIFKSRLKAPHWAGAGRSI